MGQTDSTDYSDDGTDSGGTDYSGLLSTIVSTGGSLATQVIAANAPKAPTIVVAAGPPLVATGAASNTPLLLGALVVGGLYLASQSRKHPAE